VEVSVICPRRLVEKYFTPLRQQLSGLDKSLDSELDVSDNDYIAMQVIGQGLEAGKRVLELTSPLAMAGMYVKRHESEKWKKQTDSSPAPSFSFQHISQTIS
jgi:hypothetical protein